PTSSGSDPAASCFPAAVAALRRVAGLRLGLADRYALFGVDSARGRSRQSKRSTRQKSIDLTFSFETSRIDQFALRIQCGPESQWCPDLSAYRVPTSVGSFLAYQKTRLKSVL